MSKVYGSIEYSGKDKTLKIGDKTYNVFGGDKLPSIIYDIIRVCPDISEEALQGLITMQMYYDNELLRESSGGDTVVMGSDYTIIEKIGDIMVAKGFKHLDELVEYIKHTKNL